MDLTLSAVGVGDLTKVTAIRQQEMTGGEPRDQHLAGAGKPLRSTGAASSVSARRSLRGSPEFSDHFVEGGAAGTTLALRSDVQQASVSAGTPAGKALARHLARVLVHRLISFAVFSLVASFTSAPLASSKREPQNYYGPKQTQIKPALLWVPRVVLFPVWLVSEYVIRQPVGLLVRTAEREQWPAAVVQFFTFGDRGQVTLFPSALFDFGLKPSVGFNLGWKYFLAEPNTLNVHAGFWGPDWVALRASDQYNFGASEAGSFEAMLVRRRDLPFYGMGPRSPSKPRYRYQAMTSEFALGYEQGFWRLSQMTIHAGLRTLSFGDGGCCRETSVPSAIASGALPPPPGFGAGYVAEFQALSIAIDSRRPSPADGTGVRVEAHGEAVIAPEHDSNPRRAWVGYGASAGAALDVKGGRIFGLSVATDLTDPLRGTIPFTDQVTLGGNRPMRGYLQGRLVDRSSIVATAQYTWPIWVYLNGLVQVDVGNVFGPRLAGFDVDLLRMSTGIGVRSNGSPDSGLEVLVAGGTDPFENGFHYSSFRLVIGSHHGF